MGLKKFLGGWVLIGIGILLLLIGGSFLYSNDSIFTILGWVIVGIAVLCMGAGYYYKRFPHN